MEHLLSFGFLALPTVFISGTLVGALIALKWRRSGMTLVLLSAICLYAAATPALSSYLLGRAEAGLPDRLDLHAAQAIVVLGGEVRAGDGDAIPDRLGTLSLERVMMAADAWRQLHVPVAVSGGRLGRARESEASLMKASLAADFSVPVTWEEGRSRTTWENAVRTARLLKPAGISTVALVSQAWHLPRAVWAFERTGLTALPWPAPRTALRAGGVGDFLPSVRALRDSFFGLHELIGGVYYRLRY